MVNSAVENKNSKRNGTSYIGRDITLKPDGRLNEFIAEISARYTNTKNGVLFRMQM